MQHSQNQHKTAQEQEHEHPEIDRAQGKERPSSTTKNDSFISSKSNNNFSNNNFSNNNFSNNNNFNSNTETIVHNLISRSLSHPIFKER